MWLIDKKGQPDFYDELEGFSKYWGLSKEKVIQEISSRTPRHNITVDGTVATNLNVISEKLKIKNIKFRYYHLLQKKFFRTLYIIVYIFIKFPEHYVLKIEFR